MQSHTDRIDHCSTRFSIINHFDESYSTPYSVQYALLCTKMEKKQQNVHWRWEKISLAAVLRARKVKAFASKRQPRRNSGAAVNRTKIGEPPTVSKKLDFILSCFFSNDFNYFVVHFLCKCFYLLETD